MVSDPKKVLMVESAASAHWESAGSYGFCRIGFSRERPPVHAGHAVRG